MDNKISYIKTDDNKIINEQCIRWVEKMNECLRVCVKSTGCSAGCSATSQDTHKVCKLTNLESYNKLNKHFE